MNTGYGILMANGKITVLSAYDSYAGKMFTWVQHPDITPGYHSSLPCKNHPDGLTEVHFETKVKAFVNERQLLADFAAHMKRNDPDILTGWYFVDADVSTISTRMRKLGLDPRKMSPHNQHNYKYGATDKRWTQPIPGRTCIDLMLAFKKLWQVGSWMMLRSLCWVNARLSCPMGMIPTTLI